MRRSGDKTHLGNDLNLFDCHMSGITYPPTSHAQLRICSHISSPELYLLKVSYPKARLQEKQRSKLRVSAKPQILLHDVHIQMRNNKAITINNSHREIHH